MDFSSLISLTRVSFPPIYLLLPGVYTYIHTLNNTHIYITIQNAPFTKIPGRNFQDVTQPPLLCVGCPMRKREGVLCFFFLLLLHCWKLMSLEVYIGPFSHAYHHFLLLLKLECLSSLSFSIFILGGTQGSLATHTQSFASLSRRRGKGGVFHFLRPMLCC